MRRSYLFCSLLSLGLAACSSTTMTSAPQPLFQLHGNVQNTNVTLTSPDKFRITAVWVGRDKTIPISQDVAGNASFPSAFTLDITQAPPLEAANPTAIGNGAQIRFVAELGAYEDTNGNGRFDYNAGDRLLGIAPRLRIFYIDGTDDLSKIQGVFPAAQRGFNLFIAVDDNACTHNYYPSVPCQSQGTIPLDSAIVLQLSNDAKFE